MRWTVRIPVVICLLTLGVVPAVPGEPPLGPALTLNRLAAHIADRPLPVRTDLARLSLDALADTFAEEAQRARQDARVRSDSRTPARWAVAVDALAREYATLASAISEYTPVEIIIGVDRTVYLVIERRWVAVSTPRLNGQPALERHILQQFCSLYRCDDFVAALPGPVPGDSKAAVTQWSFSEQAGPVCIGPAGLEFQFITTHHLGEKRAACTRAVEELHRLAAALDGQQRAGARIEWNELSISPVPVNGEHDVSLNRHGDSLPLALPWLASHRQLFIMTRPWLAAQAGGSRYPLVILNAGHLFGIAEQPDQQADSAPVLDADGNGGR